MQKRNLIILLIILVIALVPRVFMLTRITPTDFYAAPWYQGEGGDASEYSAISANLIEGQGYTLHEKPTTIRPPGYVYFVAGIYKIFGVGNLTAVRVAQIALAVATLLLFWVFAKRTTGSVGVAHLATLALGLYPRFALYNMVLLSETLFFLLLFLAVFLAERFVPLEIRRAGASAGAERTGSLTGFAVRRQSVFFTLSMAMLALAALTRPAALYLAPVFLIWGWYCASKHEAPPRRSSRQGSTKSETDGTAVIPCLTREPGFPGPRIKSGVTALLSFQISALLQSLAVFLIVIAPWMIFNHQRLGSFTFSSKSGGTVAEAWDRTVLEPLGISNRDILAPYKHLSEEEFARAGYKLFFTEIRDHPLLIAKFVLLKAVYWFSPSAHIASPRLNALYTILMSAVLALGAVGIWRFWKTKIDRRPTPVLVLLLMGVFSAMHILTVPYHRYRFPVMDPYLILFAAYAIVEFWNYRKQT